MKKFILFFFCSILFFGAVQGVEAATIYVNSSTGNDSSGDGSSGAPYKTFHKGYTMASADDTLDLTGTFTWTDADETGDSANTGYTIGKNLTIQGQLASSTIIQAASTANTAGSGVFTISSGVTSTINDVTIRYGYKTGASNGGGIYNQGVLIVNRSVIANNYVKQSTSGYGGGIANVGTLTVNASTVINNFAHSQGGGIVNAYTAANSNILTITNSTIAFNSTAANLATVGGAGVYQRSGTSYITNTTIAYNDATNQNTDGSSTGDTAGLDIVSGTTVYLKNSIIAYNEMNGTTIATLSGNNFDITNSGTLYDNGGNILGKVNTAYSGVSFSTTTWYDRYGNSVGDNVFTLYNTATTGTVYLDTSLADNGTSIGTQTFAVTSASSIVIDRGVSGTNGSVSVPEVDQRNFARTSTVDIGAYEYGGISGVYWTLTYSVGANGSLTGSTTQANIPHASNGTAVTAVADEGYRFDQWSDGSTQNPRTDLVVTADISVTASFVLNNITLTYSAGANGSVSGSSTQIIDYNSDGTEVTAIPDTGYLFSDWSDGMLTASRTDTSVTSNVTVTANFIASTSTIIYSAGSGGSITGSSTQIIDYGSSATTVTATPQTGYSFVSWSDGSTSTSRTDIHVTTSTSYTATFLINTYTVSYTAGANGSLTGSTTQAVTYGSDGSAVTAVPATGYVFVNWSDDSTDNPRTDTNVSGTVTVTANFAVDTSTVLFSDVDSSAATSTATITWITDQNSSSKVVYGPDTTYLSATVVSDTDPRVISHSVSLNSLVPCTIYHFKVVSTNASSATATSTDNSFTTTGCTSGASILAQTISAVSSSGQTVTSSRSNTDITVVVPENFSATSSDVVIQIKALDRATTYASLSLPTNRETVGSIVFDVKALIDANTTLDSFDVPVTMTMTYTDDEIIGITESSLWMYHYHNSAWEALDDCSVSTSENSVTCTTDGFSVFGIFGEAVPMSGNNQNNSSSGGAFTPPSVPKVIVVPHVGKSGVTFSVENVKQVAISETEDFSGVSWEPYIGTIHSSKKILYVKFRSVDGGESTVYKVTPSVYPSIPAGKELSFEGKLIKYAHSPMVYLIKDSQKRWIVNEKAFKYHGYKWEDIEVISSLYEFWDGDTIIVPVAGNYVFTRDMYIGMYGEDVKELQKYLNAQGFKLAESGVASPGQETMYFGELTQNALVRFQQKHAITPALGYFGPKTRAVLYR